jgi:predicted RNA-binding protein associated with RNAse of E/G family
MPKRRVSITLPPSRGGGTVEIDDDELMQALREWQESVAALERVTPRSQEIERELAEQREIVRVIQAAMREMNRNARNFN